MTDIRQCAEDHFKIIYPFIKQLSFTVDQEKWLLNFYYDVIVPEALNIIEQRFIAKQNLTVFSAQLYYLQEFFEYEAKAVPYLSVEALPLRNGLNEIGWLIRCYQDEYFRNIWQNQPGFSEASFYADQHPQVLRKLLKLTTLFWMEHALQQALKSEPDNVEIQDYLKWVVTHLNKHNNNTITHYHRMILEPYHPNSAWYFFNGAERFFVTYQMEKIQLNKLKNQLSKAQGLLRNWSLKKSFIDFPISAVIFSLHVLFFLLLPYRLLRTLVNEMSYYINKPVEAFVMKCNPSYKLNPFSHGLFLLFNLMIYGSLLTLFSLPLIPIPLTWVPSVFLSPMILALPISYMLLFPVSVLIKTKVFSNSASEDTSLDELSEDADDVPDLRNSLHFQYRQAHAEHQVLGNFQDMTDESSDSEDDDNVYLTSPSVRKVY